ncbi:chromosomal replication initiator protein DnaA [Synoicihabitans lomoniglobus]|uniref:Chromosomal replication initiator protein DnaA n=1 Tax=Synoicihabitans lomoniglobus TaxID=2909285 RepID=A0AAE9ZUZ2_9BACT|nr:chromosomal replication initiator protein DnaA [Opitutaceae bacterium LMO-M01]WED63539.1 chromosomal replication initiator protein DnaA [Opitutaceae bacterium LMO-M01]
MPAVTSSSSLWETAKQDFKTLFPEDVFQLWFEPLVCLDTAEDSLTLGVPNDFAAIWIHDNYLDLIIQRLRLTAGRDIKVALKKADTPSTPPAPARSNRLRAAEPEVAPKRPSGRRTGLSHTAGAHAGNLNPRNTFENFVVGSNNQMAQAASLAVAQSPAQAYNPLFLYGDTGLGKTHLMHAIGHAILRQKPDARVAYLSTEKFTNEFIQGLQENALVKFRQRYRNVDVLLLDDVQFLGGKERIQEEFFHTFNDLFESGKQIVLSSDRRASEIAKLEARLVSRFEWGLPADIHAPDFETRVAILRTKAKSLKLEVPPEVITFVAQNIAKNIRRLEGALIKVASYASLTGKHLDVPTTEMLLQDVLMEQAQNMLTIETIQKRVADHFQIRLSDMTSKRRPNNIAIPRQIAMYLSRTLTKHSLQEIGDMYGGRDHGTVIHACKAVDNMMEQDQTMRSSIEFLRNQLSR